MAEPITVVLGNDSPVDHIEYRDAKAADQRRAREARALPDLAQLEDQDLTAAQKRTAKAEIVDGVEIDPRDRIRVRVNAEFAGYRRRSTRITFPEGVGPRQAVTTVLDPARGAWAQHSDGPPAWVASNSDSVARFIAEEFGCEVRQLDLDDYSNDHKGQETGDPEAGASSGRRGDPKEAQEHHGRARGEDLPRHRRIGPIGGIMLTAVMFFLIVGLHGRTAAGRTFQARVMSDPSSNGTGAYAPARHLALTADTTQTITEGTANTTLAGELTGAGLARIAAAFGYTDGTTSYTLSNTWTYTGTTSITIARVGTFNAPGPPPAGTCVFITALSSTATVNANGDQLTVTLTVGI